MKLNIANLVAVTFMCILTGGNLAWAEETSVVPDGHTRVRFVGQAAIKMTYYENKTCSGGDGVEASGGNGLRSIFGSVKNISLGMPITPNVINLKARDGILAKAYYNEYAVNAGEPLTIEASVSDGTDRLSYRCGGINVFFEPVDGQDYEVSFNYNSQHCQINVTQIDSTEAEIKLLPVQVQAVNKCSEKDLNTPELSTEAKKAEDARISADGILLKRTNQTMRTDADKQVDAFLASRRIERGFTDGASAQCPDCPQRIESPDGRQTLGDLPHTEDLETNHWIQLIEPEFVGYVTNQKNYFKPPSTIVAIPCNGADEDMRKAANFLDLQEQPLEQQQRYKHNAKDANANTYFRDIRVWPVNASCANGKLNGEIDLWIFGNKVFDNAQSLSVVPVLRHVQFSALNGKPVGLMNFATQSNLSSVVDYRDQVKKEQMKKIVLSKAETATFEYHQADTQENPRAVSVINTIYDRGGLKKSFEGPTTTIELPLSPGSTETIWFYGSRKSAIFMYKRGALNGEALFYGKPTPQVLGVFEALAKLAKITKDAPIPATKKCFKNDVEINLDPCVVE